MIPGTPPISGPELERLEGVSAEELAAVKPDDGPTVETEGTGSLEVLTQPAIPGPLAGPGARPRSAATWSCTA